MYLCSFTGFLFSISIKFYILAIKVLYIKYIYIFIYMFVICFVIKTSAHLHLSTLLLPLLCCFPSTFLTYHIDTEKWTNYNWKAWWQSDHDQETVTQINKENIMCIPGVLLCLLWVITLPRDLSLSLLSSTIKWFAY